MQMRGKNSDSEYWDYLNPDEPYQDHKFRCDGASELCTYFPVGFLPLIEYDSLLRVEAEQGAPTRRW